MCTGLQSDLKCLKLDVMLFLKKIRELVNVSCQLTWCQMSGILYRTKNYGVLFIQCIFFAGRLGLTLSFLSLYLDIHNQISRRISLPNGGTVHSAQLIDSQVRTPYCNSNLEPGSIGVLWHVFCNFYKQFLDSNS
jgi:hypothetical protein